ncbi:MAG: SMAD/FHA domain-containing protein [Lentinula lateritia]|nr:MAG: SMAD/FHA domain-containing protein [Lentinula lateritia]
MIAKTLTLAPTESSLLFLPKQISLELGLPVMLGRQGIYEDDPSKTESLINGYFSYASGVGLNPVSKRHALVWLEQNGKVFVQDLDSSNGTYINGVKLASGQPKQLNTGDILRLGISFCIEQANIEMTPVIATVNIW